MSTNDVPWLVIEAAERDGDPIPTDIEEPIKDEYVVNLKRPRCFECYRFIPKTEIMRKFPFCSPDHLKKTKKRSYYC